MAICAEHIDPNIRWHPTCFSCTICHKLLVDLLYYTIGKEIVCEKHFKEKSLKNVSLSNENVNLTNQFDLKSKMSKQNVYHSFKQTKSLEKIPSIICAGCDMVKKTTNIPNSFRLKLKSQSLKYNSI